MKKLMIILLGIMVWTACDDNEEEVFVGPEGTVSQFTDARDGKVYQCVTIGKQTWMAENLAYRMPLGSVDGCYTYREGNVDTTRIGGWTIEKAFQEKVLNSLDLIPGMAGWFPIADMISMYIEMGMTISQVVEIFRTMVDSYPDMPRALEVLDSLYNSIKPELIRSLVDDQYQWAEMNNDGYATEYGYLYTWSAAQKALPEGWRLPTDEDWKVLEKELGMEVTELNLLEEWRNKGVSTLLKDEKTGFGLKYGGLRAYGNFGDYGTPYIQRGLSAAFWSSTSMQRSDSTQVAIVRTLSKVNDGVLRSTANTVSGSFTAAYSIRGIKE